MDVELKDLPLEVREMMVDLALRALTNCCLPWAEEFPRVKVCVLKQMCKQNVLTIELRESGDVYKLSEDVVDVLTGFIEKGLELRVSKKL